MGEVVAVERESGVACVQKLCSMPSGERCRAGVHNMGGWHEV